MSNVRSTPSHQPPSDAVPTQAPARAGTRSRERDAINAPAGEDTMSRTSVAPSNAQRRLPALLSRPRSAPPTSEREVQSQNTIMLMAARSLAEAIHNANEVLEASQTILGNIQSVSGHQGALAASIATANAQIQDLRREVLAQCSVPSLPPPQSLDEQINLLRSLMPVPLESAHLLASDSVSRTQFAAEMTPENSDKLTVLIRKFTDETVFHIDEITRDQLNQLWAKDGGDEFQKLIVELQSVRVNMHWKDSLGRTRTIPPGTARLRKQDRYQKDDVVRTRDPIGLARRAESSGLRGATEIRAHCALALQCLSRNDVPNFARIVGCVPSDIIDALLAKKHLRPGALFREDVIWELIAHSVPRLVNKPVDTANQRTAIRNAFRNYLEYHGIPLEKPYGKFGKITYPLSAQGIDGLVSNRRHFFETILRVVRASHNPSSLLKILEHKHEFASLCRFSAYILDEVLSGAQSHLDGFAQRIKQNKKRNLGIVKTVATTAKAAVGMGTAIDPTGISTALIDLGADVATAAIAAKLAALDTESVPDYLTNWVQSLRTEIFQKDLSPGTFVHGHPHLSVNEAAALRAQQVDNGWIVGGGDTTALTESQIIETQRTRVHLQRIFPDISEAEMNEVAAARDAWTEAWQDVRSGG